MKSFRLFDEREEQLTCAVSFGDIDTVRSLLTEGVDPNCIDTYGHLPLIDAVLSDFPNRVEIIQLLGEFGANPLKQILSGESAFSIAKCEDDSIATHALSAILTTLRTTAASKIRWNSDPAFDLMSGCPNLLLLSKNSEAFLKEFQEEIGAARNRYLPFLPYLFSHPKIGPTIRDIFFFERRMSTDEAEKTLLLDIIPEVSEDVKEKTLTRLLEGSSENDIVKMIFRLYHYNVMASFHWAIKHNQSQLFQDIWEGGVKVEFKFSSDQIVALFVDAINKNNLEICQYLSKECKNVLRNSFKYCWKELVEAIEQQRLNHARMLLIRHKAIYAQDLGWNLIVAAENNNLQLAFHSVGKRIDTQSIQKALDAAKIYGHQPMIDFLNPYVNEQSYEYALSTAAYNGEIKKFGTLFTNPPCSSGRRAQYARAAFRCILDTTISNNHIDLAKMLIPAFDSDELVELLERFLTSELARKIPNVERVSGILKIDEKNIIDPQLRKQAEQFLLSQRAELSYPTLIWHFTPVRSIETTEQPSASGRFRGQALC